MAQTVAADLIVPDVWADIVGPKVLDRTVMLDYVTVDDTLVGTPGNTVNFPKWNYIGDAVDLTEGVPIDFRKMSQTDSQATIKEAGTGIELSDNAVLEAIGQPDAQAQTQLALAVARKIDQDLRTAAERTETYEDSKGVAKTSSPLKVGVTSDSLTWKALTRGFALIGDEYDPGNVAVIVVHSAQYSDLLNDPLFVSADKFGAGATILRGQIGSIGTIPVVMSDRATKTGTGADTVYNALVILKGALALKYKRRPLVEKDRDISTRTNLVTINVHYATKRTDDRGVIVIPTKATLDAEAAA